MASEGPTFPTAGANNASVGTLDWADPGDIVTDDGFIASVSIAEGGGVSKYLYASTFGFAIPTGSTIDGITVVVGERNKSGSQVTASDHSVRLFIAGSPAGDNKAAVGNYGAQEDVTYGGAADKWGLTPTAEQINASGFGVGFSFTSTSGPQGGSVAVDWITITVYYTEAADTEPGAPTASYSSASGNTCTISWIAPVDDGGQAITGYRIQRRSPSGSGGWTTIVSDTGTTGTSYADEGLDYETSYGYQVAAINSVGVGAYSTEIALTTEAEPAADTAAQSWATQSGMAAGLGFD